MLMLLFTVEECIAICNRQVFWLPVHFTCRAFPFVKAAFAEIQTVAFATFILGYSGGSAPDLNGFPYYLRYSGAPVDDLKI
jgi:hypothetical protein